MRFASALAALLLAAQASAQSAGPIQTNRVDGPSPLAIAVDGWSQTSCAGWSGCSAPFIDLEYTWDFGDPAGQLGTLTTYAPTKQSRNWGLGPINAHVYEPVSFTENCGSGTGNCATFTITVTVDDNTDPTQTGTTDTAQIAITVYNPDSADWSGTGDGWGAPGKTVCVAKDASIGTGCPAGATERTSDARTLDGVLDAELAAGFRRILFKAGNTWSTGTAGAYGQTGPILIGSYGTANGGKANLTGGRFLVGAADDWRFQDFDIGGTEPSNNGWISAGNNTRGSRNMLYQRLDARDLSFSEFNSGNWPANLADGPDENAIRWDFHVDNQIAKETSGSGACNKLSGWGVYWMGVDFLGCRPNGQQNFRFATARDILFRDNKFGPTGGAGKGNIDLRDRSPVDSKCSPEANKPLVSLTRGVENAVMSHNILEGATGSGVQNAIGANSCQEDGDAGRFPEDVNCLTQGTAYTPASGGAYKYFASQTENGVCTNPAVRDNCRPSGDLQGVPSALQVRTVACPGNLDDWFTNTPVAGPTWTVGLVTLTPSSCTQGTDCAPFTPSATASGTATGTITWEVECKFGQGYSAVCGDSPTCSATNACDAATYGVGTETVTLRSTNDGVPSSSSAVFTVNAGGAIQVMGGGTDAGGIFGAPGITGE